MPVLIISLLSFGNEPVAPVHLLRPSMNDSISYDQGKLLLLSVAKDQGEKLVLSTQWYAERVIAIGTKEEKYNFAKAFYRIFASATSIQSFTYMLKFFKGFSAPESLAFTYTDTMSVREFWRNPAFLTLGKLVKLTEAGEIMLTIRGWRDSTYTTPYDDPTSDNRWLYKLHIQLIPGMNSVFISLPGKRKQGL